MSHQKKNESKSNSSEVVTLKTLIEESGETAVKIYTLAKMTKTVWYLRMNNPERFTMEEIQSLAEVLTKIATLYDRPAVTIQMVFDAIRNTIASSTVKSK